MLQRRDPVAMESVGNYLIECLENLNQYKILLNKHIDDINHSYTGVDANIIITKFKEASKKMDIMISNIEYYSEYFKILASHDRENISISTKNIQTTIEDQILQNKNLNTLVNKKIGEVKNVRH